MKKSHNISSNHATYQGIMQPHGIQVRFQIPYDEDLGLIQIIFLGYGPITNFSCTAWLCCCLHVVWHGNKCMTITQSLLLGHSQNLGRGIRFAASVIISITQNWIKQSCICLLDCREIDTTSPRWGQIQEHRWFVIQYWERRVPIQGGPWQLQ